MTNQRKDNQGFPPLRGRNDIGGAESEVNQAAKLNSAK